MLTNVKKYLKLSVATLALLLIMPATLVSAQSPAPTITIGAKDLHLTDGAKEANSAQIQRLLNYIYIAAGFVAIIVIVIGGIRYTTSVGDSSSVQSAKNTIQYAVVGLVVIIMAAAITDFVIKNVAK